MSESKSMRKKSFFGLGLILSLALWPSLSWAAVPGTPVLLSPTNNAKGYNKDITVVYWSKVAGIARYDVNLRVGNNHFTNDDRQTTENGWHEYNNYITPSQAKTSGTSGINGLVANTTYFWQVRACAEATGDNSCGNWSATYKFTTAGNPTSVVLSFPVSEKTVNGSKVYEKIYKNVPKDFKWNISSDVVYSEVKFFASTDGNCGTDAFATYKTSAKTINSGILAGTGSGLVCWQVVAYSNSGSKASDIKKFNLVDSFLAAPEALFAQTGFDNAMFYWTKNGGSGSTIEVSKDSNFNDKASQEVTGENNFLWSSGTDAIYAYVSNLSLAGKNIYWRVKTGTSAWSKTKTFKSNFLVSPTLVWPKGNQITASSSILKWSSNANAKLFKLHVAGESVDYTAYTTVSNYRLPSSGLNWVVGQVYNWNVTAINNFAESAVSADQTFTAK